MQNRNLKTGKINKSKVSRDDAWEENFRNIVNIFREWIVNILFMNQELCDIKKHSKNKTELLKIKRYAKRN